MRYGKAMVWAVFTAAALLAACGPSPEERAQLAGLPALVAERDRLRAEVERLAREMEQIEAQLAALTFIPGPGTEATRAPSAPEAVGQLVAHVGEMEEQLASAAARLRAVNATSSAQQQRIAALEVSIAEERAAVDEQRRRIAALETAISGLEAEAARQSEMNRELERTVESMTDEANKIWYVVGTKDELLDRGIVREEGGSRVFFIFGKRGQTLVPSRALDRSMFTEGDLRQIQSIPLPASEADAKWTVVTPQDLAAVSSPLDDRGRVVGDALSIADPERFWASSRYLIVVRS